MVETIADFKSWITGPIKEYFPHEMMVCAVGLVFSDEIRIKHLIGVGYPGSCLERIDRLVARRERRIVQNWLSQYRAQIIESTDFSRQCSIQEREEALRLGITNMAAYGCLEIIGQGGTYVSFSNIPEALNGVHARKLELMMPYLHQALTRIFHGKYDRSSDFQERYSQLTKREREVLLLMSYGMSNRGIAEKIFRSEATVQNHVHAIFRKLGVTNRTAAVALANSAGCDHGLQRIERSSGNFASEAIRHVEKPPVPVAPPLAMVD